MIQSLYQSLSNPFFFFSKVDNKLELGKKGFDNLANKEQGEKPKTEEEENQEQEKPRTLEETASCEHHNERERLERESQAEAEENQENDGITHWFLLVCISKGCSTTLSSDFKDAELVFLHRPVQFVQFTTKAVKSFTFYTVHGEQITA